jgi:hypothetical protein
LLNKPFHFVAVDWIRKAANKGLFLLFAVFQQTLNNSIIIQKAGLDNLTGLLFLSPGFIAGSPFYATPGIDRAIIRSTCPQRFNTPKHAAGIAKNIPVIVSAFGCAKCVSRFKKAA